VARRVIRGSSVKRRVVPRLGECHVIIGRAIAETVVAPDEFRRGAEGRVATGHQPDPGREAFAATPIFGQIARVERLVELAILQVQQRIAQVDRDLGGPGKRPRRTGSRRGSSGPARPPAPEARARPRSSVAGPRWPGNSPRQGVSRGPVPHRRDRCPGSADTCRYRHRPAVRPRSRRGTACARAPPGRSSATARALAPIARTCASRARRMPGAQPGSP
jgi:hypothetical protein